MSGDAMPVAAQRVKPEPLTEALQRVERSLDRQGEVAIAALDVITVMEQIAREAYAFWDTAKPNDAKIGKYLGALGGSTNRVDLNQAREKLLAAIDAALPAETCASDRQIPGLISKAPASIDTTRARIYIAGPMRGHPEHNFPAFRDAEARFARAGFDVVSPVTIGEALFGNDPTVPGGEYIRADVRALAECHAIALLPGWEHSTGARCEAVVARTIGMAFYDAVSGARMPRPARIVCNGGYEVPAGPAEDRLEQEAQAAMAEVRRAMQQFPTWPTDPIHGLGVLVEEVGEAMRATLQHIYEPHKQVTSADLRTEAVQVAAMALRNLLSLEHYAYLPSAQHTQEIQDRAYRAAEVGDGEP